MSEAQKHNPLTIIAAAVFVFVAALSLYQAESYLNLPDLLIAGHKVKPAKPRIDLALSKLIPENSQPGQYEFVGASMEIKNTSTSAFSQNQERILLKLFLADQAGKVITQSEKELTGLYLTKGSAINQRLVIQVPVIAQGVYFLTGRIEITNPQGQNLDTKTRNNGQLVKIVVRAAASVPPLPDLVVSQIGSRAHREAGSAFTTITYSFRIKNQGPGAVPVDFPIVVSCCTTREKNATPATPVGQPFYNQSYLDGLQPGQSTPELTLSIDAPPKGTGQWDIALVADWQSNLIESNDINNQWFDQINTGYSLDTPCELCSENVVPGTLIFKFTKEPKLKFNHSKKVIESKLSGMTMFNRLNREYGAITFTKLFHGAPEPELWYIYRINFSNLDRDPQVAASRYRAAAENISDIDIDRYGKLDAVPNDPLFPAQWGFDQINAKEAWDMVIDSGARPVVAVIDTGADLGHPDLRDNIWINRKEIPNNRKDDDNNGYIDDVFGWDFVNLDFIERLALGCIDLDCSKPDNDPSDTHGHGTAVAGIIAAVTNNYQIIASTCWKCKIMALRAGFRTVAGGVIPQWAYLDALRYAIENGAQVVNHSAGNPPASGQALGLLVEEVIIRMALSKGVAIVASAGNSGSTAPQYPAFLPGVIAVAASNINGTLLPSSTYGDWVSVAAPGVDVLSLDLFSELPPYSSYVGTSIAAPFVAGLTALMKAKSPSLTPFQIKQILVETAKPLLDSRFIKGGIIDMKRALERSGQ